MNCEALKSIVKGNLEVIDQTLALLHQFTDAQYTHVAAPYVTSSIGQHIRHIVDVFFAITQRPLPTLIDYDRRRRGAAVEHCRREAQSELYGIREWMLSVVILPSAPANVAAALCIRSEVSTEITESVDVPSTLLRELMFTSSHAVHHLALISVIAKLQGVAVGDSVGLAPATASFLRAEGAVKGEVAALCAP